MTKESKPTSAGTLENELDRRKEVYFTPLRIVVLLYLQVENVLSFLVYRKIRNTVLPSISDA